MVQKTYNYKKIIPLDTDGAWKQAIYDCLKDCIHFFYPELCKKINWEEETKIKFLDKELHKHFLSKEYRSLLKNRKGIADVVVEVELTNKTKHIVVIHIEIESNGNNNIGERMFEYYTLLRNKYRDRHVTCLTIFTGNQIPKNYNFYEYKYEGITLHFEYNTYIVKNQKEKDLLENNNIFGYIVLLHLLMLQRKNNYQNRITTLRDFFKKIDAVSFEKGEIFIDILKFIKRYITLPKEYNNEIEEIYTHIVINKKYLNNPKNMIGFDNLAELNAFNKEVAFYRKQGVKISHLLEEEKKARESIEQKIEEEKKARELIEQKIEEERKAREKAESEVAILVTEIEKLKKKQTKKNNNI